MLQQLIDDKCFLELLGELKSRDLAKPELFQRIMDSTLVEKPEKQREVLHGVGVGQGCIRRQGISEAAPEAFRCWYSCDPMCSCVLGCVLACGTPFGLSGAILFSLPATCVSWYVPLGFFQTRRPRISALLPPDPEPGPCEDKEGVWEPHKAMA